jgi:hypothetical protein
MAKTDEIKFLDQHMEKVILGVCALIMAYGVFQWVLSSPPRVEVPKVRGRAVPATELDQELLSWAQSVRDRKPPKDDGTTTPKYDVEISKQRTDTDSPTIANWGMSRSLLVPPKQFKPDEGVSFKMVEDIVETFSPEFTEVKGLRELVSQEGGVDKLVFRGKANFPAGDLLKALNKLFRGSAMDDVVAVALAVEIEKRAVLGDGQFGPVTKVARVAIPLEDGQTEPKPIVVPEYDGKNADDVRKAIEAFAAGAQSDLLRPKYWQVWSHTDKGWTTPWIKKPATAPVTPAGGAKPAAAPVVEADDGMIEVVFHDADVAVQRAYSYRMQLAFVSPLYTHDDIVHKSSPDDAKIMSVSSGWSQWVLATAIPRTTQYFLTSAQGVGDRRQLKCTIFTRCMGRVVSEKNFAATPGRIIGGVISKKVQNPVVGKVVSKVVDFSTNAIVVNVDFDKKIPARTGRLDTTREMICLEGGKLVSHILVKDMPADDPRSEIYKELQAQIDTQTP